MQKRTFKLLFMLLAIMLVILPFVTTFNSFLTTVINNFGLYKAIQDHIVPFESKLVVSIVRLINVPAYVAPLGQKADFFLLKGKEYFPVDMQWNCLGWQSLLLLFISFLVGFQGNFNKMSKFECVMIGLLGTFLINVFRMVFIVVGVYYVNTVFAFLIHDYFAAFTTVVWLFFFWWFSYKYVLENRKGELNR